jgi:hypothetical protein
VSPLALPGFLAFFVVALVVGVRLVLLAGRTRQLPELLMGVGVLGIGPLGFGGLVAALELDARGLSGAHPAAALASLAMSLGIAAKYVFNWRIYRSTSRLAALAALGGVAAVSATLVLEGAATGFSPRAWMGPGWHWLRQVLQVGCLLWGACEALRYGALMRRRQRLGLADPLVTNRFLLWGVGAGAAGLGSAIGTAVQIATGQSALDLPWLTLSSSLHGLVAAVALWLAFVPPAAYRRWIAARAAA